MARRDPDKSARNRIIENIKTELRDILPEVLKTTGVKNEASLNAKIGSKNDDFIDLKHDVISSHEEFINKWLQGLKAHINTFDSSPRHDWIYETLKKHTIFQKYLLLFLKRSYLKHFDELSKLRPKAEDSELWIGQTNANYGLLVTPRFNGEQWENDKSEIRAFKQGYWSIGHVMKTGLVIPGKEKIFKFADIEQYLLFFTDTLVRNSGSKYEYALAEAYADFVRNSDNPLDIPLMIPEFRYKGLEKKHKYRLDFMIINPFTLDKVGFELSPWSSHGYLTKTKGLTQKEINQMAQDNFEKEMKKHRGYFKKYDVFTLIYTDEQLADCNKLFEEEIKPYLLPERPSMQLSFQIMEEFL
ncbi:topoisomerase [Photobacterium phosphoreum]|uniref:topoisomerase n=1 Tax=Photobacterium phosphoreum TaxID=659 RepID=UPI000D151322|nr:topoisomerase [Photobacterium phosphoreum]PSU64046.1 topoisomerase [Photobacterium phosphoreum]